MEGDVMVNVIYVLSLNWGWGNLRFPQGPPPLGAPLAGRGTLRVPSGGARAIEGRGWEFPPKGGNEPSAPLVRVAKATTTQRVPSGPERPAMGGGAPAITLPVGAFTGDLL